MTRWLLVGLAALIIAPAARAEDLPPKYRAVVDRGLKWLVKQQNRDGHWEAAGSNFASAMTAMGGTVLLMEGSTIRDGKYSENIRKAADWLMERVQRNGLIGDPNAANQGLGYMYGHGFSILFLSQIYGEEEDADRRKKLEDILTRAVQFSGKAQTTRGGWGYVSAADGSDFDEGSVTITQVQALRAARNAGIVVPKEIIDKARDYLKKCTNAQGGIIYSLGGGGGGDARPALTAAAIACGFSAGEYNSGEVKKWLKYCKDHIPLGRGARVGHDEYTHYYYAQAMYTLGEDGYAKLFPESAESDRLTWSKYRKATFDNLIRSQGSDGSWTGGMIGPIFITTTHLAILQLDNGTLPIYQK